MDSGGTANGVIISVQRYQTAWLARPGPSGRGRRIDQLNNTFWQSLTSLCVCARKSGSFHRTLPVHWLPVPGLRIAELHKTAHSHCFGQSFLQPYRTSSALRAIQTSTLRDTSKTLTATVEPPHPRLDALGSTRRC